MKHEEYFLEGEGAVGLKDSLLDFRARLVCMEGLSAWIIGQNPDFKPFENVQGRVIIPFLYRGFLPQAALEADWETLGAMLPKSLSPKTMEGK